MARRTRIPSPPMIRSELLTHHLTAPQFFATEPERLAAIVENVRRLRAIRPGDIVATGAQFEFETQTIGIASDITLAELLPGRFCVDIEWAEHYTIHSRQVSGPNYDGTDTCLDRQVLTVLESTDTFAALPQPPHDLPRSHRSAGPVGRGVDDVLRGPEAARPHAQFLPVDQLLRDRCQQRR